jgi:hypothetical protein
VKNDVTKKKKKKKRENENENRMRGGGWLKVSRGVKGKLA